MSLETGGDGDRVEGRVGGEPRLGRPEQRAGVRVVDLVPGTGLDASRLMRRVASPATTSLVSRAPFGARRRSRAARAVATTSWKARPAPGAAPSGDSARKPGGRSTELGDVLAPLGRELDLEQRPLPGQQLRLRGDDRQAERRRTARRTARPRTRTGMPSGMNGPKFNPRYWKCATAPCRPPPDDEQVVLVQADLDHVPLDPVLGGLDAGLPGDVLEGEQRDHAEHSAGHDERGARADPLERSEQHVEGRRHRAVDRVHWRAGGRRRGAGELN